MAELSTGGERTFDQEAANRRAVFAEIFDSAFAAGLNGRAMSKEQIAQLRARVVQSAMAATEQICARAMPQA